MFKKFVPFIISLAVLLNFLPVTPVWGQYGLNVAAPRAGYANNSNVYTIVNTIISVTLGLIAILLFGLLFLAGFKWMTAHGNETKVEEAKEAIKSAAIGLMIVFGSYAITYFVFSKLAAS